MKQANEEINNAREVFGKNAEAKREQRKQQLKETIRHCGAFLLGILCGKLMRLLLGGG